MDSDVSFMYKPLTHLRPCARISPFSSAQYVGLQAATGQRKRSAMEKPSAWLDGGNSLRFYRRGAGAIGACLRLEHLKREDEVLVITTTQGPYLSSHFTDAVEEICTWSRRLTSKTRLAIVIHEFGFPCEAAEIRACQDHGIPILEDCAYALGSRLQGARVGSFGDYAIYSLTKHYPIPFGGVLVAKRTLALEEERAGLSWSDTALLVSLLRRADGLSKSWNQTRRRNWRWFARRLRPLGMEPYFRLSSLAVPGVFALRLSQGIDGAKLKRDLVAAGIESTEYYGMGGFYLPVHQFLTEYDREYILHHVTESLLTSDSPPVPN